MPPLKNRTTPEDQTILKALETIGSGLTRTGDPALGDFGGCCHFEGAGRLISGCCRLNGLAWRTRRGLRLRPPPGLFQEVQLAALCWLPTVREYAMAPPCHPSPPLSIISPNTQPPSSLPVCAVFTMDAASNLISNLALYFDRWKLAQDKWDKTHPQHIDK